MRTNRQIRVPTVRLISQTGEQVGVVPLQEALERAEDAKLDLVEISPRATPPVCKIIDYGKYRYDKTKKERENKKLQHQIKIKEVKVKPNIGDHDLATKIRRAKEFIAKGCKVKLTCSFRGREVVHPEIGQAVLNKVCEELEEVSVVDAPLKRFGRIMTLVLAPKK